MSDEVLVRSLEELREWLRGNHDASGSVWLVRYRKGAGPTLETADVVDELLCWGWIDSQPRKVDDTRSALRISPRNPRSNWSKVNKEKVERLQAEGRMQPAGERMVALAQKNGTWTFLDDVDALTEPDDLRTALDALPDARRNWDRFPPSSRRGILEWIKTARTGPTRADRIAQTVSKAERNRKANFPEGRDAGPKPELPR